MDIDLLQTFVLVARQGGFRSAAEKHFLTPSAVSSRIRLLEDEIGAKLFERGQFGTRLTLSGQRLLDYAEDMLSTWNRIRRDVAIPSRARHILAIGATDTIWHSFLVDALSDMHGQDPTLALRMETGTAEGLLREVMEGTLDAVCLFDTPELPVLHTQIVAEVSLKLVSTDQSATIESVMNDDHIRIEWGKADESFQNRMSGAGSAPMIRTSAGWLGLQWLLKQGGSAYLPETLAEPYIESGVLFNVSDAMVLKRSVHLIYPVLTTRTQSEITKNVQAFAQLLQLQQGNKTP